VTRNSACSRWVRRASAVMTHPARSGGSSSGANPEQPLLRTRDELRPPPPLQVLGVGLDAQQRGASSPSGHDDELGLGLGLAVGLNSADRWVQPPLNHGDRQFVEVARRMFQRRQELRKPHDVVEGLVGSRVDRPAPDAPRGEHRGQRTLHGLGDRQRGEVEALHTAALVAVVDTARPAAPRRTTSASSAGPTPWSATPCATARDRAVPGVRYGSSLVIGFRQPHSPAG
jgi:hypothetical protein